MHVPWLQSMYFPCAVLQAAVQAERTVNHFFMATTKFIAVTLFDWSCIRSISSISPSLQGDPQGLREKRLQRCYMWHIMCHQAETVMPRKIYMFKFAKETPEPGSSDTPKFRLCIILALWAVKVDAFENATMMWCHSHMFCGAYLRLVIVEPLCSPRMFFPGLA